MCCFHLYKIPIHSSRKLINSCGDLRNVGLTQKSKWELLWGWTSSRCLDKGDGHLGVPFVKTQLTGHLKLFYFFTWTSTSKSTDKEKQS